MKKIILFLTVLILISVNVKAIETQIFYDDFKSGIDNWDLGQGWSVILENGNQVLQGTKHSSATAFLDGIANKLELRLKLLEGSVHLNIRSAPTEEGLTRYFIGLNEGSSYIQKQIRNDFQGLEAGGKGISSNEWHKIKIEIIGEKINLFVDGDLILSAQDKDLIKEGGVSFETLEDSKAYLDDIKIETEVPEAKKIQAEDLFSNGKHEGDITLGGRDSLILEDGEFEQFGNVYLKDSSKLIIRDSTFKITRYQRLLNHWGIYLGDIASLEIENSRLEPGEDPISHEGTLFVIEAGGKSSVSMKDSPTKIHLFTITNQAKALVENSEIVGVIGGLIGAFERAEVKIINSKIGAVNLHIPPGATFEASGLRTGFFEKWNLHEEAKVSGINYNITLINTELVKDKIGPGPFERGWPVFIESDAHVKIKDSELRKVVITLRDEKAEFANFSLETPTDFNYRNINLENVIVKGQWGIFLHGSSDVTVRDSDAFWTFIYDDSKLTLVNTHMNEFDPRNFHGEMIFENSRWDTAAEILENNDFIMAGSLEIEEIGGFSWENSKVTRIYEAVGRPNAKLILVKNGQTIWSGTADEGGKTSFSIKFDDNTFDDAFVLQDNLGHKQEVTFFSKTPIDMEQSFISKFIQKMKLKGTPFLPGQQRFVFLLPPLIIILLFLVLFFYLRKKRRQRQE